MTMSFGNSNEYLNGFNWVSSNITTSQAVSALYATIVDGAAAGARVFLVDMASENKAVFVTRSSWWNQAARQYNAAHRTDKICVAPMYEDASARNGTTEGALPIFDALDAGGMDSPMCAEGGRPVVAVWGNGSCINPMTALALHGPFTMIGTVYNTALNYPDQACVTAWKNAGNNGKAVKVFSYLWSSGNSAFANASTVATKKKAIEATGAEMIMGIGTSRSEGCGDGGAGPKGADFKLTDFNFFEVFLEEWRLARVNAVNNVMLTMGFPGDTGEGSHLGTSIVCGPNDQAPHNVSIGAINQGFSCPNIPDAFTAALPSGFAKSLSMPLWYHGGFWRAAQVFSQWQKSGMQPVIDVPFIAVAYRQHPWALTGLQTCSTAASTIAPSSLGGQYWGDNIALTSWAPTPTRVRVKLGGRTLFDGTLPARQMALADDKRQTKMAIGSLRGRPTIEVINSAGNVIVSKVGRLKITDTPLHWGGKTGRNPGIYVDYMNFPSQ